MDPVFVPQAFQKDSVESTLEEVVLDFVVLVGMQTEFLELIARNDSAASLLLLQLLDFIGVIILICPEAADFDLSCGNRALGINHDGNRRVLNLLIILLCVDIDSRQPAAVARMRVVPSTNVLRPSDLFTLLHMREHIGVSVLARVDTSLRRLDGQRKCIHDVHSVADWVALHVAHNFDISTGTCVHYHLDQSHCGYFDFLKVIGISLPGPCLQSFLELIFIEVVGFLFIDDLVFELEALLGNLVLRHLF